MFFLLRFSISVFVSVFVADVIIAYSRDGHHKFFFPEAFDIFFIVVGILFSFIFLLVPVLIINRIGKQLKFNEWIVVILGGLFLSILTCAIFSWYAFTHQDDPDNAQSYSEIFFYIAYWLVTGGMAGALTYQIVPQIGRLLGWPSDTFD